MKHKFLNGKEVPLYTKVPKGWQVDTKATTAPVGTVWCNNKESFFSKKKKICFVFM